MKQLTFKPFYYVIIVTLFLNSCRDENDLEISQKTHDNLSSVTKRVISMKDHEKFIADNGLKLAATFEFPTENSGKNTTIPVKVKELITTQHLNQLGLSNQQIKNIYQAKLGGFVEGVFINSHKTNPFLFPSPLNNTAYLETGTPTIESFISQPDQAQILFSEATVYNGTSSTISYSKQLTYTQGKSISHTITVSAGVGSTTQFSLSAPIQGVTFGLNESLDLNLSVQLSQSILKEESNNITNTVTSSIPANKKLFVYAIQKIKKGSAQYSVPVNFTGNVSVKRFPFYTTAPASYLQENKSKVQKGTINSASYLSADIYVKELGINDPIPNIPL